MSDIKLTMLPPRARLTLDDGTTVDVERIGRGRYTTAWKNSHYVYLQTHEKDNSKDLLASVPANPHIPTVTSLGYFGGRSPFRLYREPLYKPLTAKDRGAWTLFKKLHQAREDAFRDTMSKAGAFRRADLDAARINEALEVRVQDDADLPETIKAAIRDLAYQCANYGAYCIEITKKNCAVHPDTGDLILLDPCFDLSEVRDSFHKRARRSGGVQ